MSQHMECGEILRTAPENDNTEIMRNILYTLNLHSCVLVLLSVFKNLTKIKIVA